MAPVPFTHPVRHLPLILAAGHLSSIAYFTYAVCDSLYTSYKSLGPVSNTRSRIEQRRKYTPLFLALAGIAFLAAAAGSIKFATLSYRTWAYEHGLDMRHRLLDESGNYLLDDNNSSQLYIAQWLSDTPIYRDALEIVAERARRFWWGQQIDLGITAFSLMLATEGRRRNIPMLTAFLALAHLVNLSFALNLFFVALLLTPSPLPEGDGDLHLPVAPLPTSTWIRLRNKLRQPKPTGWVPNPPLLYGAIALNLGLSLLLPYAAETSTFSNVAFVARASTFLPILLPKLIPVHWGSIQQHPHGAYESLTKLFRFLSAASFALHMKTSIVALLSNQPNLHYHRHSALFPWDVEERSRWERGTSALGKVLGSAFEHPVVASVAWDVVQCALSLGFWAAIRGINAHDMLISSIPYYNSSPSSFEWTSREKGRLRNDVLNFLEPSKADTNEEQEDSQDNATSLRERRRIGSAASESDTSDDAQIIPTPSKQPRGRLRKSKQPNADSTDEETSSPREQPQRSHRKQTEEDDDYKPTPATARSALEGDESPPEDPDWESGSLAWGLATFGGLASACAGVFGGECISR
ncbi:hypothetical protein F5B22DRAFT_614665 [Xylaria bambusicola]|uniref:uncharacterized protein n=1 Tax=Xylaria bambusicola TaxID=326684 RepID=UPI002008063D|nr:uncharacterized protein F5B22DRAFT_614665 [Xylaria bambusicola]KAI0512631.1 hypothetical protein F5B22DRAFT_614665 [Xylaria bambusicola]